MGPCSVPRISACERQADGERGDQGRGAAPPHFHPVLVLSRAAPAACDRTYSLANTPQEPISRALLGQRARRRLHHAGLGARSRRPGRFPQGTGFSARCGPRTCSPLAPPTAALACSRRVSGIAAPGWGRRASTPVLKLRIDKGQTTHKSADRHAQQCVWHAGLCSTFRLAAAACRGEVSKSI